MDYNFDDEYLEEPVDDSDADSDYQPDENHPGEAGDDDSDGGGEIEVETEDFECAALLRVTVSCSKLFVDL